MVNTLIYSAPFSYRHIKRLLPAIALLLSLIAANVANAAELSATVDRDTVIEGESVALYIEGSDLGNTPDVTSLLPNFDILHSGQSNSESIVNGKRSSGFTMRLELQPKSIGSLTIPAFSVSGVSSDPLTIEVVARGTPGVEPRDKVFAEVSVENENPYVQEQVILELKVFDDGNVSTGNPVINGNSEYQVQQLPGGREQIVEREGVQYRVQTFRYALFAQKSGDVTIDAITIPGGVRDPNYGGNLFLRSTPTRRIEVRTEPLQLSVKERSADNTASWWLPVQELALRHEWSDDISTAKAGEPMTLTLELVAAGATSTQLPEIPVPELPGVKIYVDNPDLRSRADADTLVSLRREKWSVIPNQSGEITLPEIVVKWWDTGADVERQAVLPPQVLQVEGAPGTEPADSTGDAVADSGDVSSNDNAVTDAEPEAQPDSQADTRIAGSDELPDTANLTETNSLARTNDAAMGLFQNQISRLWFWLALAAMSAWLATLAAWWWSARSSKVDRGRSDAPSSNASEQKAFKKLRSLSRGQDATAYGSAVLKWAQLKWTREPVHNLPEIGVRLGSPELSSELRQLDQLRFSPPCNSDNRTTSHAVSLNAIQVQLEAALKQSGTDTDIHSPHALPQL